MKTPEHLTTRQLADKLGISLAALRKRVEANPELYPRIATSTGYRYKLADVASMPTGDLRKQRGIKDKAVARRVKAARVARGLKLEEAHLATGISVYSLMNYENGRRGIPDDKLSTLARAYGVSVKYLLSGKDE